MNTHPARIVVLLITISLFLSSSLIAGDFHHLMIDAPEVSEDRKITFVVTSRDQQGDHVKSNRSVQVTSSNRDGITTKTYEMKKGKLTVTKEYPVGIQQFRAKDIDTNKSTSASVRIVEPMPVVIEKVQQ